MRYKESHIPITELKKSAFKIVFNHFKIPEYEQKDARHYHFVKHSVGRLMELKLSGVARPIITRKSITGLKSVDKQHGIEIEGDGLHPKVSSVYELSRLGRSGYKINGYVPSKIDFINYPNSCYTDEKKLAYLNKLFMRGQIDEKTFDDLKSVLVILPKSEKQSTPRKVRFSKENPWF